MNIDLPFVSKQTFGLHRNRTPCLDAVGGRSSCIKYVVIEIVHCLHDWSFRAFWMDDDWLIP